MTDIKIFDENRAYASALMDRATFTPTDRLEASCWAAATTEAPGPTIVAPDNSVPAAGQPEVAVTPAPKPRAKPRPRTGATKASTPRASA